MAYLIRAGTALYHLGIRLAAPFVPKAKAWVDGRTGIWERLQGRAPELKGCLWVHCASVGEFEQGRPVVEALKAEHPDLPVLLTFFSPSGYEAFKDCPLATHVDYLPPDSHRNAERFLGLVLPRCALFVKYEFWYAHLLALAERDTPTFLVSAIFRRSQPFFKWYGTAHRRMLRAFSALFVQDERSKELLERIGIERVTVSGDTRFDRVGTIVAEDAVIPMAAAFRKASERLVLVAGSTWPADENRLLTGLRDLQTIPRILIAPHELGQAQLRSIGSRFPGPVIRWTAVEAEPNTTGGTNGSGTEAPDKDPVCANTLLVDRMGLLSRLYKYADITYVGGGFGSGIHNVLEAAAWGKPVIFGPDHERYAEAQGLILAGGGFEVKDGAELGRVLKALTTDPGALQKASEAAHRYVADRTGATRTVVNGMRSVLS
jgi:3-deoxy-D-manno-octulosonic-acid transferase